MHPQLPEWRETIEKSKQRDLYRLNTISDDTWDRKFLMWKRCTSLYTVQLKEAMKRIYNKSFSHYKEDELYEYINSLEDFNLLIQLVHIEFDIKYECLLEAIRRDARRWNE
jgi:hypothetical protein